MTDYDRGYDQGRADCIEIAATYAARIKHLQDALQKIAEIEKNSSVYDWGGYQVCAEIAKAALAVNG